MLRSTGNEALTDNFSDVVAEVREFYEYQAEMTMPTATGSLN